MLENADDLSGLANSTRQTCRGAALRTEQLAIGEEPDRLSEPPAAREMRPGGATSLSRAIFTRSWTAITAAMSVLLLALAFCPSASAQATGEKLEDPAKPGAAAAGAPAAPVKGKGGKEYSFIDYIIVSGLEGYTIILLSFVMVGFMIEHFMTIRKEQIMPEGVATRLQELVAAGKLDEAILYCQEPGSRSLLAEVVLAGLERYKASQFGFAEYKAAVEEAGEEQTSQLYRKTEVLSVIGAIAPMLGLLGTVRGMILAFREIAMSEGAPKPADLADPIGLALVTTFEGLVVAIPAMIAYSYFRNLIDSMVSEAGKRVERILTPLNRPTR